MERLIDEAKKALECCTNDNNWNCNECPYSRYEPFCKDNLRHDLILFLKILEQLREKEKMTGVFATDGTEIMKGDKVTGLFLYAQPITGSVIFRDGSFGVEWDRGGTMEFTPFTSTCNVKWEVVKE